MTVTNPMDYIMPSPIQEYDITGMVSDSLKHFYSMHETTGYKSCTCNSCRQLAYPILIKRTREPKEYEHIHRSYLAMVQDHQTLQTGSNRQYGQSDAGHREAEDNSESSSQNEDGDDTNSKVQNIKLIFF